MWWGGVGMFDTLVVIPARRGSSFRQKNVLECAGRPLVEWTMEAASGLANVADVIISTDDFYVGESAKKFGFRVLDRPASLADDRATLDEVLYHIFLNSPDHYRHFILLPPTSPLRTGAHVRDAFYLYGSRCADGLISVREERRSIWKRHDIYARPIIERKRNRQLETPVFVANGSIFIVSRKVLARTHRKVGGRMILFVMSERDSLDVHDAQDLDLANYYLSQNPSTKGTPKCLNDESLLRDPPDTSGTL